MKSDKNNPLYRDELSLLDECGGDCPLGIDHKDNMATALRERVLPNNDLLAHEQGFMKNVIGEFKGLLRKYTNKKEVRI